MPSCCETAWATRSAMSTLAPMREVRAVLFHRAYRENQERISGDPAPDFRPTQLVDCE